MQLEDIVRAAGIGQLLLAALSGTLGCLVVPLPLRFHAPFIRGVVLPLAFESPGS
jgi:hypothetical protein